MLATSYRSPKTRVRRSATAGRGLFAIAPIRKGEIVSVRGGHILPRASLGARRLPSAFWGYPIADGFVLGPLTARECETVMMFLNHSCEPNVGIAGQIVFVAMRAIRAGEELTIDYAMFGGDARPLRCNCQTASCRKLVRASDWRVPELRARYRGHFAWQVQQRMDRERRQAAR
jgi:SET domain-containing protein